MARQMHACGEHTVSATADAISLDDQRSAGSPPAWRHSGTDSRPVPARPPLDILKWIRTVPLVTHRNDHFSNAGKLGARYIIAPSPLPSGCDQTGIH